MKRLFLQYYWRRFIRYFENRRLAKIITAILFGLVLTLLGMGVFFFFRDGFSFLIKEPFLRQVLPLYVYEVFLLLVAYLVLTSGLITGLFILFRGPEDNWIMATPQFHLMPVCIYFRVFVSSLWPLLVIALPALLAMWQVFNLGVWALIVMLLSVIMLIGLVIFWVMIILLGLAGILRIMERFLKKTVLTLRRLALWLALVIAVISFLVWRQMLSGDLAELLGALDIAARAADIGAVARQFQMFPSHLSALTLSFLQSGYWARAVVEILKLTAGLIGSGLVLAGLSLKYLPLWQSLQERGFEAKTRVAGEKCQPIRFPRYFRSPVGVIFEKEFLITFRNIRNVMWFGFLSLIWLLQTAGNIFLSRQIVKHSIGVRAIPDFILLMQFVTIVYFISAFVLRFTFPSFSMEGRTAWLIASAPLKLSKLFWAKFFFYILAFTGLGLLVGTANILILNIPLPIAGLLLFAFVLAIVFITTLGLGLGALFPNFTTDDPQVLGTSLPGLAFIFVSLFYGGVGTYFLRLVLLGSSVTPLILLAGVSVLLMLILLYFAPRSLSKIDFIKTTD